jgi:hypothetical protein
MSKVIALRSQADHAWAMMLKAMLWRRVMIFRTLATVSVSFSSEDEAKEFMKLLTAAGRASQ